MSELVTTITSFESLADAVRSGNACIPITRLSGGLAKVPKPFFGSLVIQGEAAELRLRASGARPSRIQTDPPCIAGISQANFLQLDCVLDGHLKVRFNGAYGVWNGTNSRSGTRFTYVFNEISTCGKRVKKGKAGVILFSARIANTKLEYKNTGSRTITECDLDGIEEERFSQETLTGDIPPYRYKIRQNNDDVHISVKLLEGHVSPSVKSDEDFMSALVSIFSWINGGHPHTYFEKHTRDGVLVKSVIRPICKQPRPIPRVMQHISHNKNFPEVLSAGIRYLQKRDTKAKNLRDFLWQYRDATRERSISVSMLLQSCTLLEGITGFILRHSMKLSRKQIEKLQMPNQLPSDWLKGHAEARFYRASLHLGFDWNTEFEPAFKTWKKVRNALAHGDLEKFFGGTAAQTLDSYAATIQAFNAIVLREIGYTGAISVDGGWHAADAF